MSLLIGQVAIVTGASRQHGIGRATALKLASMGATVVPVGRAPAKMHDGWRGPDSIAEEIAGCGEPSKARYCDITQSDEVENLFDAVVSEYGRLDILVNNAGSSDTENLKPIFDLEDSVWDHGMDVNVRGPYLTIKFAMRKMIAQEAGAIVNVSSLAGRQGMANYGSYCAAKFGIIGLTQQAALEGGRHNVRVNCVCPGATDTDMLQATMGQSAVRKGVEVEAVRKSVARGNALRRIGAPSELAAAIAFLASPESSFVTGQTLNVCGGQRLD